jgi:hypothetical protein
VASQMANFWKIPIKKEQYCRERRINVVLAE